VAVPCYRRHHPRVAAKTNNKYFGQGSERAFSQMALPLRCAASLPTCRRLNPSSSTGSPTVMVIDRQIDERVTASHRLAAHQSGRAIRRAWRSDSRGRVRSPTVREGLVAKGALLTRGLLLSSVANSFTSERIDKGSASTMCGKSLTYRKSLQRRIGSQTRKI